MCDVTRRVVSWHNPLDRRCRTAVRAAVVERFDPMRPLHALPGGRSWPADVFAKLGAPRVAPRADNGGAMSIEEIGRKIDAIATRLEAVEKRVERGFHKVDLRLAAVETRLAVVESRLNDGIPPIEEVADRRP